MYTIAAILGEVITPYTKEILEVLNHCRFDKIKPVREAAIEAINLVKDLDPGMPPEEDMKSQDSSARRDRASRTPTEKPWKKKKVVPKPEYDDTSVGYSNRDEDEEIVSDKKISLATRKRLEATKAKKNKSSQNIKKPNLNKEKKSIFEQKRNPNFFGKQQKEAEPEVKIMVKDDEDEAPKDPSPAKQISSGKRGHNFYQNENFNQMEDTPDFQDTRPSPFGEVERPIDYVENHQPQKRVSPDNQKHKLAKYDLTQDDDEDEEAVNLESSHSRQQYSNQNSGQKAYGDSTDKSKKHKFYDNYDQEYTDGINEFQLESSPQLNQKVEETPEAADSNVEYVTQELDDGAHVHDHVQVVNSQSQPQQQQPQQQPQRAYKKWERGDYNNASEKLKNRHTVAQEEPKRLNQDDDLQDNVYTHEMAKTTEDLSQSSNQMMGRLRNLKEQCNDIETNMDMMIEASKTVYDQPQQEVPQDPVRHTINLPQNNYYHEQKREFSDVQGTSQPRFRSTNISTPSVTADLSQHRQQNISVETPVFPPSHEVPREQMSIRRSQDSSVQIDSLKDEVYNLRAQQDKILEMQNIFQGYITNELTTLKNRMNRLETDIYRGND